MRLKKGDQIAYFPDHALPQPGEKPDFTHPGVEFGFVSSSMPSGEGYFCRYWNKFASPGTLRTTANSEATHLDNIIRYDSVSQELVQQAIERYEI
jgi:hypothetical protein